MEKEFIPYEQALALMELGFKDRCLAYYADETSPLDFNGGKFVENVGFEHWYVAAPLYQQAFKWFREKYNKTSEVSISANHRRNVNKWMFSITYLDKDAMYEHSKSTYPTYEEAELACLKKLIEICQIELKRKLQE